MYTSEPVGPQQEDLVAYSLADAGVTTLAAAALPSDFRVHVDCATAYFTVDVGGQIQLAAVPKAGGAVRMLPSSVDAGGDGEYAFSGPIVTDDDAVYWVSLDAGGNLLRVAKDGTDERVLASDVALPVAIDDAYAYFYGSYTYDLRRVPKMGGAPESMAPTAIRPTSIAADERAVYWARRRETP